MTSDRPDTSTVRTALAIVESADELAKTFGEDTMLDVTATLLLRGTDLPPSQLATAYAVFGSLLDLRPMEEPFAKQVREHLRLCIEGGRELRPYQRTDVLDALESRWGLGGVVSDDADQEADG